MLCSRVLQSRTRRHFSRNSSWNLLFQAGTLWLPAKQLSCTRCCVLSICSPEYGTMRNKLIRCVCINVLHCRFLDKSSFMGKASDLGCDVAKGLQLKSANILKHHKSQPYHSPILSKINPVLIPQHRIRLVLCLHNQLHNQLRNIRNMHITPTTQTRSDLNPMPMSQRLPHQIRNLCTPLIHRSSTLAVDQRGVQDSCTDMWFGSR